MFPNMEDRPRQKSMMKKSTDHSGDSGILVRASVKTINASPVPSTPCTDKQTVTHARHIVPRSPSLSILPLLPYQPLQMPRPHCEGIGLIELSCEITSLYVFGPIIFQS